MKSGLIASPLDRSIYRMLYRRLSDVVFFIRIPIWWKRPRLSDFLPAVRPEMPAQWRLYHQRRVGPLLYASAPP